METVYMCEVLENHPVFASKEVNGCFQPEPRTLNPVFPNSLFLNPEPYSS